MDRMLDIHHHFLDTNILIGYTVDWDPHHHPCDQYIQATKAHGCCLHTSQRVYEEARNKIEEVKRKSKQVLERIPETFDAKPVIRVKPHIRDFTLQVLSDFEDDSTISAIIQYFSYRNPKMRSYIDGAIQAPEMRTQLDNDFQRPLNLLTKLKAGKSHIKLFDQKPTWYPQTYSHEFNRLENIIEHTSDTYIALDAYHLLHEKDYPNLVLASLDKHLINPQVKTNIESCLSSIQLLDIRTI